MYIYILKKEMQEGRKHDIHGNASLLKRGLLRTATEDEQRQLQELLKKRSIREVYEQLENPAFLKATVGEYQKYASKKAFDKFLTHVRRKERYSLWRWCGAAAAVLLVVVFVWRGMITEENPTESTQTANTIEAGEKRAALTLADGRVVEVSSENILIQEKNGAEINYTAGTLSYNNTSDNKSEIVYNELSVPLGGESRLLLSDGTTVWLNAGTKLRYPVHFTGAHREVYLEGEAYFDVTKSTKQFIVETSFGKVRVLGTSFGIHAYSTEEECLTTLVDGKVNFDTDKNKPIEIAPGEQITASKSGEMKKRTVNIDEYVGWKDGIYIFREKPLGEIMNTLARWYDISVSYQQPNLQQIPFTGSLKRSESINAFLHALSRTGDLQYTITGNKLIFSKEP